LHICLRYLISCKDTLFGGNLIAKSEKILAQNLAFAKDGFRVLEKRCNIGAGSVVRQMITIGSKSIIGSGSVVVKDIEPYSKSYGNPARHASYHKETGVIINEVLPADYASKK
jgi:acyl-[acyl carrier protein]--UDP-N-acetylglucosamine O-acyltransferase